MKSTKQKIWFVVGWLSLAGGSIGILLPVIPASPLVILAAYAFSKSSKRYHKWLTGLPYFGPMIEDWDSQGVMSIKVKWLLGLPTALLTLVIAYFLPGHVAWKFLVVLAGLGILTFIWSRPSSAISQSKCYGDEQITS